MLKVKIDAGDAIQLAVMLEWVINDTSSYYHRPPRGTKGFARAFSKRLNEALANPE